MFSKRVIIFILLSFLVLMGLLFFRNKVLNFVITNSSTEKDKFETSEPLGILKLVREIIKENHNIVFSKPTKDSLWWISEDGWNILDNSALVIEFEIFLIYNCSPAEKYTCAEDPTARLLNKIISKIFERNDFQLDKINSSISEKDKRFYDYIIAFKKEKTKCTLTTSGDKYSSKDSSKSMLPIHYTVACADKFEESYNEQIPYLKALDNRDSIINLKKRAGNFVYLDIHYRRTGFFIIGEMAGEKIKIVFAGQEYPPCNLMIGNSVPKEIYEKCDESNYPYQSPSSYQDIWSSQSR